MKNYSFIQLWYIIIFSLLFFACQNKKTQDAKDGIHQVKNHDDHSHGHHNHEHKHKGGNEINKHMHNTSVDDLIKRFESPERDLYQQPMKVLDYIGDIKGKDILDIGAGSGYFSVKMVKRGARMIAGDVDVEFLSYMRERMKKEKILSNQMEVRKLPFDSPALKPNEIDKAIIVNTYHHIENRVAYFEKVRKGLRDGGELIVIDFFKKELPIGPDVNHKFSIAEVKKELTKAGYKRFVINSKLLEMQYIIRAYK